MIALAPPTCTRAISRSPFTILNFWYTIILEEKYYHLYFNSTTTI
jgi:hypothetical protein